MALIKILNEASKKLDGVLGVAVEHLESGEYASLNGDELFPSASVRKIPILAEFFRQVEKGDLCLDQKITVTRRDFGLGSGILKELTPDFELTLRDLASLMMILSDNTAADIILEKVGLENITNSLQLMGLNKTKLVANSKQILFDLIGWDHLPPKEKTFEVYQEKARKATFRGTWSIGVTNNNVTTPNEMLRLLKMIVKYEVVNCESSTAILDIMNRCQTGRYRISKYLPRGKVFVADKTGEIPGIRNDVGVITVLETGERYILSCFTKKASDIFAAEETIATVSKNIYEYFSRT